MPDLGRAGFRFRAGHPPALKKPVPWTPKAVREKADALEARGAGRITLAAETISLMVAALRFLATEGMVERRTSYTIEVWDVSGNHIIEYIGALSNHAAARAAFGAACEARPDHEVTLRQGIRVVEQRGGGCGRQCHV